MPGWYEAGLPALATIHANLPPFYAPNDADPSPDWQRVVQLLLGPKIESTVGYRGVEVDDALEIEKVDI